MLLAERGEELFRDIFHGSDDLRELWGAIGPRLADTRIEVTPEIAEATAIPWELIRDPRLEVPIALSAQAFVRGQRGTMAALLPHKQEAEKVRILLVICRPKGGDDVPFRSVAGRLVTRLSDEARGAFDLDVLRPPTYEQLAAALRLAKEQERPYHVVHFDGHGAYADPADLANVGKVLSNLRLDAGGTAGAHGFLMFEDPGSETRSEFVDGLQLGALLRESGVPLLVLNACQSAFAEAPAEPETATAQDTREEIAAYGSLAQAVMDAGAAGVVAMRYSICGDGGTVRGRAVRGAGARADAGRGGGVGAQELGRPAGTTDRLRGAGGAGLVGAGGVGAVAAAPVARGGRRADQNHVGRRCGGAARRARCGAAGAAGGRLLRPRRDALRPRSRLRHPFFRAAACLRRQRQEGDRGGVRALVRADWRRRGAGAVH